MGQSTWLEKHEPTARTRRHQRHLFVATNYTVRNANFTPIHVYASGWKTARVVVQLFEYGGWVGWGGVGY